MSLRNELLKSVWYAFTSLDTEKSGKVSKSQLKVSAFLYSSHCHVLCLYTFPNDTHRFQELAEKNTDSSIQFFFIQSVKRSEY